MPQIIRKINPATLLVVIIDAADNSVNAANQYKENCFVHDLVKMSVPEGSRLIITARSERLSFSVKLPIVIRAYRLSILPKWKHYCF